LASSTGLGHRRLALSRVRSNDAGWFAWPSHTPPLIAEKALKPNDVPSDYAGRKEITWFAASIDGYNEFGADDLGSFANTVRAYWDRIRELPEVNLRGLRACLFFEYRRHSHFGHAPDVKTTPYIRALVAQIRALVVDAATPP
jgi:hypothetical protein